MDRWDQQKRSKVMAKIKAKDTQPELIVRRYLYARGFRYRKNVKNLPGTPDIVLKKYKTIIFIHGCFWHGHILDGHIPHTNSDFWKAKIERNQARDKRNNQILRSMGWNVMTVWECQLKKNVREQTLNEIVYLLSKVYLEKYQMQHTNPYPTPELNSGISIVAEDETSYG